MIPRQPRRALAHAAIAAFLYLNGAAMLAQCDTRIVDPSRRSGTRLLPNHWATERLFLIFGVFSGWSWQRTSVVALGSPAPYDVAPATPSPELVDLHLHDLLPYSTGEDTRMLRLDGYPAAAREAAYTRLAGLVRTWHNRRHPDRPMAQVFIYRVVERKSADGQPGVRIPDSAVLLGFQ